MVIYCRDEDYEAAKIIADVFGTIPQKICNDILDYIKQNPGTYILVGGERANPTVERLVREGYIEPIARYYNKCVIQRAKVGNSIVWVIAGWEKEHTLWIANTIRITGALPDMDYIESTVGVNILVFDIGYIPKLLELDVVSPIAISLDIFTKIIERLSPNIRKLILAHKPHIINTFNAKWYLLYQDKVQATAGYRYVSLGLGAAIVTAIIVAIVAVSATIMVWRWSEAEIWRHKAEITRVQEEYEFRKYLVNTMKENPELAPYISDYLEMWEKYRYEIEKKRVKEEGMLERFEKIMWMGAFMMMALIGGILVIKLIEVIGK